MGISIVGKSTVSESVKWALASARHIDDDLAQQEMLVASGGAKFGKVDTDDVERLVGSLRDVVKPKPGDIFAPVGTVQPFAQAPLADALKGAELVLGSLPGRRYPKLLQKMVDKKEAALNVLDWGNRQRIASVDAKQLGAIRERVQGVVASLAEATGESTAAKGPHELRAHHIKEMLADSFADGAEQARLARHIAADAPPETAAALNRAAVAFDQMAQIDSSRRTLDSVPDELHELYENARSVAQSEALTARRLEAFESLRDGNADAWAGTAIRAQLLPQLERVADDYSYSNGTWRQSATADAATINWYLDRFEQIGVDPADLVNIRIKTSELEEFGARFAHIDPYGSGISGADHMVYAELRSGVEKRLEDLSQRMSPQATVSEAAWVRQSIRHHVIPVIEAAYPQRDEEGWKAFLAGGPSPGNLRDPWVVNDLARMIEQVHDEGGAPGARLADAIPLAKQAQEIASEGELYDERYVLLDADQSARLVTVLDQLDARMRAVDVSLD